MAELSYGDCQRGSAKIENFESQVLILEVTFKQKFKDLLWWLDFKKNIILFWFKRLFRVPSTVLTYLWLHHNVTRMLMTRGRPVTSKFWMFLGWENKKFSGTEAPVLSRNNFFNGGVISLFRNTWSTDWFIVLFKN